MYFSLNATKYSVRVGSSWHANGGTIVKVKKIYRHGKYKASLIDYDFTLLELAEPLTFNDSIQAIELASKDIKIEDGTEALVTGWGN